MTAPERVPAYDAAPTFAEQGINAEFVNWRGFFAAPGLPEETLTQYQDLLAAMMETPEWAVVRASMGLVKHLPSGRRIRGLPRSPGTADRRPDAGRSDSL